MLSVGTEGKEIGERTEREDAQRTALGFVILASGLMMITTPTSLSDDIKNLKQRWGNLPFVHGKPGELEPAKGPIRELMKMIGFYRRPVMRPGQIIHMPLMKKEF